MLVTIVPPLAHGISDAEHRIDDELVFSNHTADVFHDSRETESGSMEELGILQQFIRQKCRETRRADKPYRVQFELHAIWFVFAITKTDVHVLKFVPMDNQRPQLNLTFQQHISRSEWCDVTDIRDCIQQLFPVPVIVVW
ncbi:hypothetical protein EDB89DRAFT_1388424 [Lactarius sanguifluus]|nr:hypothetical protein EDB89DRAFT_1388424 [Lactarius sanguifluus]